MAVTIRDVSARCGLSVSTVSKAFNNYADISEETRELVRRTAQEIGYFPNAIARTLKTNRSYNLGILYDDDHASGLTHAFFASLLEAFKCESERHGYDLTFINHHIRRDSMTYLEHCRYRNVDGVFIACAAFDQREVRELGESDIPCVTVDYVFPHHNAVLSDNRHGMRLLTEYAIAQGHRRIAYIYGQPSGVTDDRLTGYRSALDDAGIERRADYEVASLYDMPDVCRDAVLALLRLEDPPTCIFLPDDHCCIGALQAAADMNLSVPGDLSLAGYDGIQLSRMLHPRLTTVMQDTGLIGTQASRMLIDSIEHPSLPVAQVHVPVQLIPGESVGRIGR